MLIRGTGSGTLILGGAGIGSTLAAGAIRSAAGRVSRTRLIGWDGRNHLSGLTGKNRLGE